jgi:WD40 repeat protein
MNLLPSLPQNLIRHLNGSGSSITSRPEPEVTHPLQALTPYILDASTPENERDLRTYLLRELQPFAGGEETQQHTIDTIISLSEGIFLYVEWIRRELSLGRLSLNRLEEFPRGLGGVYAQFIERQFSDIEKFKILYRPVLELIAAAREPLEIDYIASIFSWSVYDKEDILDAFGSLFSLSDNRIQPFHKSFPDWLNDPDRAGPYFTSTQEGHKRLVDHGWQEYQRGVGSMSPYSVVHLPAHISVLTGRKEDLRKLLFDFKWMQAKLDATDVNSLISDYDYLSDDSDLRLVQGAVRLSSNALARDSTQLAGQLLGRLQCFSKSDVNIQSMLEQACKWKGSPWLCPLESSLIPPGGPLVRTLEGHTGSVSAVAVTPDGRFAISASDDETLKVWDIEKGEIVHTLEGHTDRVNAVAVTQDGRFAVSASGDQTLKVWDIEKGEMVRTLEGHTDRVNAVAVTQDGRFAVSASDDGTLKMWDIEKGETVRTLEGHTGSVSAVAVTPDGRFAVSASDDRTLKVWDLQTGKVVAGFSGDGPLLTCAISTDGTTIIAGDQLGRVHFLQLK